MTLTAERDTEVVYPDPTPPVLGGFQGLPARPGWFSQHLGTAALGGVLGWLIGIGALNYPLAKMVGFEPRPDYESTSWTRYLRYTADHKVVGMQYVIGVL